jgi:hypothetical protein
MIFVTKHIIQAMGDFDPMAMVEALNRKPMKPRNTRTKKTAWKERRPLANAPKSIQKRVLKRK